MLQQALLREYGIRNCVVRLDRLAENDILIATQKKLRLEPKMKNVRLNVSWLPAPSSTKKNSVEALSTLDSYRHQNSIVKTVGGKNVKRQRAKSMFIESNSWSNNKDRKKATMDDMHLELAKMYSSPKRGLKLSTNRQLPELQPQPLSDFQKMANELKAKVEAKKVKTG